MIEEISAAWIIPRAGAIFIADGKVYGLVNDEPKPRFISDSPVAEQTARQIAEEKKYYKVRTTVNESSICLEVLKQLMRQGI